MRSRRQEGAISDDAVETVAGGFRLTSENAEDVRKGANDQFRELKKKNVWMAVIQGI